MGTWKYTLTSLFGAGLLIAAAASAAHAQPAPPPPPAQPVQPPSQWKKPSGLVFGFGIGGGSMNCESADDICNATLDEAGGFDVHVGAMISPRLSIQGELWPMFHTEDRVTISHVITTVAAQYWLLPRLWIKGGVGGAYARAAYKGPLLSVSDRTDTVPAVMAAVGYEIVGGKRFVLDIQLRGGTGFYDDDNVRARSTALQVGFNWY